MQCDFCGAKHPEPNQPGACVMFWQRLSDYYCTALVALATKHPALLDEVEAYLIASLKAG